MATWSEVRAHLATTYADVHDRPADVVLFSVPLDPAAVAAGSAWPETVVARGRADAVAQPVAVHRVTVLDEPWLHILGAVGSARDAHQRALLVDSLYLPIGAFCLRDGALVLRQVLPLDGLELVDLDDAVRAIAGHCAWMRGVIGGAIVP